MPTVTNNLNSYVKSVTSATTAGVLPIDVPSGTDIVITGLIVSNTYTDKITVNVKMMRSSTQYFILRSSPISVGESQFVIGWDQKVVLKPGDNIVVQTTVAGQTADVVMSTLEITTT